MDCSLCDSCNVSAFDSYNSNVVFLKMHTGMEAYLLCISCCSAVLNNSQDGIAFYIVSVVYRYWKMKTRILKLDCGLFLY